MVWKKKIVVNGRSVEISSADRFDQNQPAEHQYFDVSLKYNGKCYMTSFLTLDYMNGWKDEEGYYYPDPSFVVVREITEENILKSIEDIITYEKIERFFEPNEDKFVLSIVVDQHDDGNLKKNRIEKKP